MNLIPDDQRNIIDRLIEEERIEDALTQLAEYVEANPTQEILCQHIEILMENFDWQKASLALAEHTARTLDKLAATPETQPYIDRVDRTINELVDAMQDEIREEMREIAKRSEALLPLAPRWPSIYGIHGQALLNIMTIPQRRSSFFSREEPPARVNRDDLLAAKGSFEKALAGLDAGHPMYKRCLLALIEVFEHLEDHEMALQWCEKGDGILRDLLETWDKVGVNALKKLLQLMDDDIRRRRHNSRVDVVQKVKAVGLIPEISARYADRALRDGDLKTAEALYKQVSEDKRDYRENEEQKREILRGLRQVYERIEKPAYRSNSLLDRISRNKDVNPFRRSGGITSKFMPRQGDSPLAFIPPVEVYGLPRDNMRLYGISGLIAVADKRGDSHEVLRWIYEMLEDRQVPAASNTALLDRLEALEMQASTQTYHQQVAMAAEAYRAGDVATAKSAYLQATASPMAEPADFMWLAVCMAATGDDPDTISHLIRDLPPETITAPPRKDARFLLDYLSAGGHWALTDRFIAPVQTAKKWLAGYQERRQHFRETQADVARAYIASGRLGRAQMIAADLLAIDPDDTDAALIMGRVQSAQRHWSAARRVLAPLEAHPEAQRLLMEIDLAEGRLQRAEARLRELDDQTAADGVRRRMEQTPFFRVAQATHSVTPDTLTRKAADVWNATFAVRLTGVHVAAQLPSMQHQIAEFLIGLHRVDQFLAQPHFTWRYIGRDGRLTIALICRVEASAQPVAESTARTLWHIIRHLLPYQTQQIYTYDPVIHPDELDYLIQPLNVESAAQITRTETQLPGTDTLYRVQSFGIYDGNMHRLLRLIADHPGGAIMETYFHPTDVYAWERAAIEKMLSRNRHGRDGLDAMPHTNNVMVQLEQSAATQAAAQVYQDFFGAIQSLPFIVQTRVAASGSLDPALPEIAGLELFGPSAYRVLMAYTQDEVETARRTIGEISGERWGYTAAPDGLARWRYLLTPMETLTATRLPVPNVEGLPGVQTLAVRVAPLPNHLPEEGAIIGESIVPVRGKPAEIRLSTADRLRHAYLVGRTGTGKSTLLQNMALQDIEAGLGVGIIDPHGDLVENLLPRIPAHRRHDVILLDPGDVARPMGLNILDVKGTHAQNVVISDFIGLLYTLFDPNRVGMIGPRFENAVRNSMLLAMDISGSTFIEVVRILTDKSFREKCLELVTDPIVKSYWTDVAPNIARMGDGDMLDYVTSKFGRFINDRLMRNIIGQSHNALDLRGIMNDGKILLVNLAKGKMGSEASHFLGLLLMPQIFVAALSRANLPEAQRRLFCLYVDEFHNFTTPTFSTMLAESRKYGVALTVANQFISQLTPNIREAVFGNVGTLLSFRVGIRDAQFLAQEYYPVYGENDLINLPNYYMLAKMLVDGDAAAPFPVRTLPDNRVEVAAVGEQIRGNARMQYGRDERVVNMEIRQRYENPPRRR